MNLAEYSIKNKAVIAVFSLLVIVGGWLSYQNLGRLEDPEFTIKEAVVYTRYPGATALEVEEEVTEVLETAIQQVKQLEEVRSISQAGLSIIYAEMQDKYDKDSLPQVWDELRRKVSGAAASLPPGCASPIVNDDFGDVYGIFIAITGDGYDMHDLREVAKDMRRELLLCDDVGRIDFWGEQQEAVFVEIDRVKIAALGVSGQVIFDTLNAQNIVAPAGLVGVGPEDVRIRVSGEFEEIEDLENLLVSGGNGGRTIQLRDVAKVERGYITPPMQLLRYNGVSAIGLGISTVSGGNVVTMGDSVKERLKSIQPQIPLGVDLHEISWQSDTVRTAVNGFVLNLLEALVIVIILLVIFMGLREGFIIGFILLLTILGTFIGMEIKDVNLQRISLGALIIALGMLVDNAIVVVEGIVIKMRKGVERNEAAFQTVRETQWPLLGATLIAIMAFAAISISKDKTGEFLGSLFMVIAISLGLSWLFAITVTPCICVVFLPKDFKDSGEIHNNLFYKAYRGFLRLCIRFRYLVLAGTLGILLLAGYGFGLLDQNFFPNSPRPQYVVDVWHREGTRIAYTAEQMELIRKRISEFESVGDISSFIGGGAMRFILTYAPEMPSSAYGQLLISVDDPAKIPDLIKQTEEVLLKEFSGAICKVEPFKLGPGGGAVEARLMGPDIEVLRDLAQKTKNTMREHSNTQVIRDDWGAPTKVARVDMREAQSRNIGVSRQQLSRSLEMNFSGYTTGIYRDGDDLLPIMLRPPEDQHKNLDKLDNIHVWSTSHGRSLPIEQLIEGVQGDWEDPRIRRLDRTRTITVSCRQKTGTAMNLFKDLRPMIEAIDMPDGYKLEWGGEYENSTDANQKLMAKVPLVMALMFFVSVILFNSLRHPIIIFAGLPLALIGVSAGLLIANQPFGFMALLGFLSLSGMLIKNEIVLLDQINLELADGKPAHQAILDAAVSRVRPVSMAAFTTVLGMIPLLWDVFFVAMAVTIMAGLTFATILTLVVVPVLYATFFRVHENK